MIRILLIEDLAVVRDSLALALAATADMDLRCCSSLEEGIALLDGSSGEFDIVLLKQCTGGPLPDGFLSVANRIGLADRVLILTPGLSQSEQQYLAGLGVAGIFAKQRPLLDLIGAIRQMAGGRQSWIDQLDSRQDSREGTFDASLSRQERRAAAMVLEGLANKEIAARMSVSESRIKALLQRTFLKLGVRTRTQLVRVLMQASTGRQPRIESPLYRGWSMKSDSNREAVGQES